MNNNKSFITNMFHKNGRALGSIGYFTLLMAIFLIGAPEAWIRPNLHQSVFVMMPTLIFLTILICELIHMFLAPIMVIIGVSLSKEVNDVSLKSDVVGREVDRNQGWYPSMIKS